MCCTHFCCCAALVSDVMECSCFRWFFAPVVELEEIFKVFAVVRHPWLSRQAYTCFLTGSNFFPSSGLYSSLTP